MFTYYLTYQSLIKIIIMSQFEELQNMQSKIFEHIQRYQQLRKNYNDCAGQKFLKFLTRIMSVMSEKIKKAQHRFQHIDEEIDSDARCQYLFKQNRMYELQTINMLAQLQRIDMQIEQTKQKNQTMKKQIKDLRSNFYNKSKFCVKYTRKAVSLNNAKIRFDKILNNSTNLESDDNNSKDIKFEDTNKDKKKLTSRTFGFVEELQPIKNKNHKIALRQDEDWSYKNNKTQYRKFFQHKYRRSFMDNFQMK